MRYYFFVSLCCLVGYMARAQSAKLPTRPAANVASVRAMYRLTYRLDSLNKDKVLQEDFRLLIGKNLSLFVSANRPKRDSAMARVHEQSVRNNGGTISLVGIPKTRFSFYIYKSPAERAITTYEQLLIKHYRIEEAGSVLQWHLLADTQRVAGYACRQAFVDYGGRHWRAWFTTEVPISDGPYKFSGLPGLIVRVQDVQGFYTFELTSLTKLINGPAIALPTWTVLPATRAQFRQIAYNYKLNPFAFMDTEGDPMSTADQQLYRERTKTNNNAIERH